jgi:hypothetical protein
LAGHHLPQIAAQTILGSLGGALAVARIVGGSFDSALAHIARVGSALGNLNAFLVAAGVTGAGTVLVLAALPSGPSPDGPGSSPFSDAEHLTVGGTEQPSRVA